ncbi:MAG: hypothetical protein JNM78_09585 [Cyclobacteriaceae bacterium]|nr:hypothetical protein [Cyclobacteriaceae bacterium]
MAKSPAKTAEKKVAVKKAAPKSKTASIDKVSESILAKLKALNIEHQLQANIEWCIGSYNYDKNPAGLKEAAVEALAVFKQELAKKTKGVTAAFVKSIEAITN